MPVIESMSNHENNSGHLPLSWVNNLDAVLIKRVKLFKKFSYWIPLSETNSFTALKLELDKLNCDNNIIVRGCSIHVIKGLFGRYNKQQMLYGKEAVLSFYKDHFNKKSLKQLIKRGLRHGNVDKIEYSADSVLKLNELKLNTIHSNEPQLKNLYIDFFHPSLDLFVFIDNEKKWIGAVTISKNSPEKLHTELLLRHKDAPIGVMEALIFKVYQHYQNSEFSELSLGEVPFTLSKIKSINFWNRIKIIIAGKIVRNAYNFEGLFKFKNKFDPEWNDIYLIGIPKVYFSDITVLALKSKLIKLIIYKIWMRFKEILGK